MTSPANRDVVAQVDELMLRTFAAEAKFLNWLLVMRPLGSARISTVVAESGKYPDKPLQRHRRIARTIYFAGRSATANRPSYLIDSMNEAHQRAMIPDADLRYVLSIFVVGLRRALARHAWRPLTESEVDCVVAFYRNAGTRMGLTDVPDDYAGFAEILDSYEREYQHYHPSNHRLATMEVDLVGSGRRAPVRWFLRQAYVGLMDDPLRTALGLAKPFLFVRAGMRSYLSVRARVRRWSERRG